MFEKNNEFWTFSRGDIYLALWTFVILLLTTIIFFLWRKLSKQGDTILLVGLSGAGKTAIFTRLINPEAQWKTYTSLIENTFEEYLTKNGQKRIIVDYPGAETLRKNLFLKYIKKNHNLKGIIFVVDSYDFYRRCKDVSEFLYDVLYESGRDLPILVACNKQNIEGSFDWEKIRDSLEKEFGLINVSREASLSSTNGDSTKRLLTSTGSDFSWGQLKKAPKFEECIAESENPDEIVLEPLQYWIDSL